MLLFALAGILGLTFSLVAPPSEAGCDFQAGSATRLRVPMVRSYQPCGWWDGTAPSTASEAGVGACAPISPTGYVVPSVCSLDGRACSGADPAECPTWLERKYCRYCGMVYPWERPPVYVCATNGLCSSLSDCGASPNPDLALADCSSDGMNVCTHDIDSVPPTPYRFRPSGACALSARSTVEKDCSRVSGTAGVPLGLPQRPCHVTTLRVRCQGILAGDGSTPIGQLDQGWMLRTLTRATFDDPISGDMTQIDFPVWFSFDTPVRGAIELEVNSAEALTPYVGATGAALPPCAHIQPLSVEIRDPWSRTFAIPGLATRP